MFDTVETVEPYELERIRRSIAMLSPGQSLSGISREDALDIISQLQESKSETARYQAAVAQLKAILQALEGSQG